MLSILYHTLGGGTTTKKRLKHRRRLIKKFNGWFKTEDGQYIFIRKISDAAGLCDDNVEVIT